MIMTDTPNKLSQFWQELKRRNVVRVITIYAGAAFVILELVSIIVEPLKLPEWLLPVVIVLLCIGFIIAIILSWIYDIHPEEGIVKTESAHKAKAEDKPVTTNSWRIASYISFVVIMALILINVIPRSNRDKEFRNLEKSIAVLPFENMSNDEEYSHLGGAFTDEIIMELQKIAAFDRVLSRTSTMQYEENRPTIPEIAAKLNVNYLIEGSIQRHEDDVRIRIQVIRAIEEDHIWAEVYEGKWKDIFSIQAEIAFEVASELEMVLTPQEKQLIEKIPTTNLTAYDFYQRGREEYWRSRLNREYSTALKQAEYFFNKALENDPGYALAYAGLAMVHCSKYYTMSRVNEQYSADFYRSKNLDSMNLLAQKSLVLDDQIADAYFAKGIYEQERGNLKEGLEYMNGALKINPNHIMALTGAASIYGDMYDFVNALTTLHKAASMERGSPLPVIYLELFAEYWQMDFPEKSLHYLDEYLSLSGDSITYFIYMYARKLPASNQEKANKYAAAAYEVDSSNQDAILYMGRSNLDSKRYEEAYPYYLKYFNLVEASGDLDVNDMNRMGHVLWMTGRKEEAQHYFQEMIYHCKRHIEINSSYGRRAASYDLAGVYAFIGEKDSAYYYLEEFSKTNFQTYYVIDWLNIRDPLFESIRKEDRFQKLLRDMEDKHRAEHGRVRKWLEENDML